MLLKVLQHKLCSIWKEFSMQFGCKIWKCIILCILLPILSERLTTHWTINKYFYWTKINFMCHKFLLTIENHNWFIYHICVLRSVMIRKHPKMSTFLLSVQTVPSFRPPPLQVYRPKFLGSKMWVSCNITFILQHQKLTFLSSLFDM